MIHPIFSWPRHKVPISLEAVSTCKYEKRYGKHAMEKRKEAIQMQLQERLDAFKKSFEAKAPKDALEIMHRATEKLPKSGIL